MTSCAVRPEKTSKYALLVAAMAAEGSDGSLTQRYAFADGLIPGGS